MAVYLYIKTFKYYKYSFGSADSMIIYYLIIKDKIAQVWNPLLRHSQSTLPVIMSDYFHTYLNMDHTLLPLPVVYRYGKQLQIHTKASLLGAEFMHIFAKYGSAYLPSDAHITPKKQWNTSSIVSALARYKRRRRVKRDSRKAGITLS